MDATGQLAPPGTSGELLIGGEGVALGYLNRPELTEQRFVSASVAGAERVYRTGDLVRWNEDGLLDFLGRSDQQVKVRGHRIELGEIEAVLNHEPTVRHGVVSVVPDAAGEASLVAYVVPDGASALGEVAGELKGEHIEDWQRAWDSAYEMATEVPDADPTLNTRGWNSSYDAQPIPSDEMRQWRDATVSRVLTLEPRRILEVGCGTGMLLFALANRCEAYIGTDISRAGLTSIARNLDNLGVAATRVTLLESEAGDLSVVADEAVDTVIVNSVAQYFPSVASTLGVLERAIRKLVRGGRMFVGDVRDFRLHAAFWASVHMHRADARTSAEVLRQRIARSLEREKELLIDRNFFAALPGRLPRVSSASVLLKRGSGSNEMVRFRYDVVLHLDEHGADETSAARTLDWRTTGMTLAGLSDVLNSEGPSGRQSWGDLGQALAVRGIPNSRTLPFVLAARVLNEGFDGTLGALRREVEARSSAAIDPESIWAFAEARGLAVELTPSLQDGDELFDAVFRRSMESARGLASTPPEGRRRTTERAPMTPPAGATASPGGAQPHRTDDSTPTWQQYGNNPLQGRLAAALVPGLRRALAEKLPSYMVPSAFVFLDALPLTPNAKVDRRALPAPERQVAARHTAYVPPRDSVELQLVRMWEDILGLSPVSVHDDFFELGGHSILSVRLFAQIEKRLGKRVPLSSLLEARTVEALAQRVRSVDTPSDQAIVAMQTGGKKPPLFCVHPAGGDVLCYLELSRALGPDYPFYAFEAAVDSNGVLRHRTVTEMAAAYLEGMRKMQAKGPYRIAGWSLGGLVAAEMAEMLAKQGESVAFVALFDTVIQAPGFTPEFRVDVPQCLAFVRYLELYHHRTLGVAEHELAKRRGDDLIAYLAERMHSAQVLLPGVDVGYARRLINTFVDHTKAYFEHVPSRFTSRMTLMRARTPSATELVFPSMPTKARTLGWNEYCVEPLTVIDVAGDHMTMLSPGLVGELAERLRIALDESEQFTDSGRSLVA